MVILGGHRGSGCTDHDFYQTVRDIDHLPVENTVASVTQAFHNGAAYVEIDALITRDGQICVAHNTVPKDHFFGYAIPDQKLNHLDFATIRQFATGRHQTGEVALLSDILTVAADLSPRTAPWVINIELKHSAGSQQPYSDDGFFDRLAEVVAASPVNDDAILFSSFAPVLLHGMSHRLPHAHYGALFREEKPGDDRDPPRIGVYTDYTDDWRFQYHPFQPQAVEQIVTGWAQHAHPQAVLGYMHPEILTVSDQMIDLMADQKRGLNVWALFETLDAARIALYRHVIQQCNRQPVPLTIITDYVPEMRALEL